MKCTSLPLQRREFITLLGGAAAAWPLAARAQQPERVRRIGVLMHVACGRSGRTGSHRGIPAGAAANWAGPTAATCGSTIAGRQAMPDRMSQRLRRNWSRSQPDVILATGGATVAPLLQATRTVPIVFALVLDPVGAGFVDEPGAAGRQRHRLYACSNTASSGEMAGTAQRDRAARDASGGPSRSCHSLRDRRSSPQSRPLAPSLGVEVIPLNVRDASEIERAVAAFARSLEWRSDRNGERVRRRFIAI